MLDRVGGKHVWCALVAVVVAGSGSLAQEPSNAPRYQGGVELIQLSVSVLDNNRRPVRGLTAADFTVRDGGVEKPVRAFTAVEIPARQQSLGTASWTNDVAPDVATNQVGEEPGRLVVILMDRSIPHESPVVTARKIAIAILDAMGPNDLAALISTSGGEPQNFTSDRARLVEAINQRDWATDSDKYPWDLEESLGDGRCLCGLCVLETVTRVADAVRGASSRSRSLFFIGKGIITQAPPRAPTLDPGCDRLTRDARLKMLDAIARSNLTVHSIDPSGLYSIGPQTRASTPGGGPAPEGVAARLRREAQQRETNVMLATQETLRILPNFTGGRTVANRNFPEEVVPDIFRESESYYLIGFEAAVDGRPRPRSIEVNVNRRGVRVATQRQYLVTGTPAASGTMSPSTGVGDVSGLLPDGAPPLRLSRAAFAQADGPNAFVSVSVDVSAFVRSSESSIPVAASIAVVDQRGRPVANARERFVITGGGATGAREEPIELQSRIELPPGDYELRVAVADDVGTQASVFSHIVVPEFATERLSLSDIVVDQPRGDASALARFVSAMPTSMRTFRRDRPTTAFVQVYQGTARADRLLPVSIDARIVDVNDHVVHETNRVLAAETFQTRRADYRTQLPVQDLAPGQYLLRIVATDDGQTASRAMRFTVN